MKKQIWLVAILAVLFMTGMAFGKSNIGFKGVGPMIGLVGPEGGIGTALAFGGVADLGWITPQIGLEANVIYWGKSYDSGFYTDTYSVKYSQFSINAVAKYYFGQKKGSKFNPYAGGGLGMGFWKVSWPHVEYLTTPSTSGSDIVIVFVGGSKMALSPTMDGFAEFRYSTGGMDFWGIFAGAIFKLNK